MPPLTPPPTHTHARAYTQVGRYGPELFDFSAERVTRSVAESLQRLQVPYIDLIQCHDIEFASLDQVRAGGRQWVFWGGGRRLALAVCVTYVVKQRGSSRDSHGGIACVC